MSSCGENKKHTPASPGEKETPKSQMCADRVPPAVQDPVDTSELSETPSTNEDMLASTKTPIGEKGTIEYNKEAPDRNTLQITIEVQSADKTKTSLSEVPIDLNVAVTPKSSPEKATVQTSELSYKSKEILKPCEVTSENKQISLRGRQRVRVRKRKRRTSNSSSDEEMNKLPENAMEVDRKLQETAARNNLTQEGVKKILKKVVTNDHVLAYVALREEEESGTEDEVQKEPKITRAKAKELTKHSPSQAAPWNLELTPIKHIPVKTTPEVTALIAQELPDESDEEYHPTNDDVLSDDDPTLESCSDLESQPRTPATPASIPVSSPQPDEKTNGPFKVPTFKPGSKRRNDSEEEATIARRTRSKLCLSETPIESIEQSFVPPDDVPAPSVDDLWSNFLTEVLHPTLSFRNEEDDDADPEYNVATDHDDYDDDEEALEQSLANISRKELDELYNELMSITDFPAPISIKRQMDMDEDKTRTTEVESNTPYLVSMQNVHAEVLGENVMVNTFHKPPIPIKEEPLGRETEDLEEEESEKDMQPPPVLQEYTKNNVREVLNIVVSKQNDKVVEESVCEEASVTTRKLKRPPILRSMQQKKQEPPKVNIVLNGDSSAVIEPAQVLILEQQLRMHIQIATANYLQIFIHPRLWTYAPAYKDYLIALMKMAEEQKAAGQKSVVDVCNLRPALELVNSWEQTVSQDTPENQEMVQFLQKESEKCMKRNVQNIVYLGSFHETLLEVISNSAVFVYPYLLPPVPFRCDSYRRQCYLHSEDCLIALGLEQFYEHVNANREAYNQRKSVTLTQVVTLVVKHMLPWARPRAISYHIQVMRRSKDPDNPIKKFFEKRKVDPVQHKLLSFNANITLHEQPEYEMPLNWVKYISKQNKRAHEFVLRRARLAGHEPAGVEVDIENRESLVAPIKKPLPIIQTKEANKQLGAISFSITRLNNIAPATGVHPTPVAIIQMDNGGFLVPVSLVSQGGTVNSTKVPILSTKVAETVVEKVNDDFNTTITSTIYHEDSSEKDDTPQTVHELIESHCKCCILMKKIKIKWPLITNYFKPVRTESDARVCCVDKKWPKLSTRLKYFLSNYRTTSSNAWHDIHSRVNCLSNLTITGEDTLSDRLQDHACDERKCAISKEIIRDLEDKLWATSYMNKLAISQMSWNEHRKSLLFDLLKNFKSDCDSPVDLYMKLSRLTSGETSHWSDELVGLLTGEQAEKLGCYRDYFIVTHLQEFTQLIRREIKEIEEEKKVLNEISLALAKSWSAACELCCALLSIVRSKRRLCDYIFNVTPHRVVAARERQPPIRVEKATKATPPQCVKTRKKLVLVKKVKQIPRGAKVIRLNTKKHGIRIVNKSSSVEPKGTTTVTTEVCKHTGEVFFRTDVSEKAGVNCEIPTVTTRTPLVHEENSNQMIQTIPQALPNLNATDQSLVLDTPELTISKTEIEDSFKELPDSNTASETQIKIEPVEWSREEDKMLLHAIKLHATPEETKENTILDVLEGKGILRNLQNDLNEKLECQIRVRIEYLLQILCMNENR